MSLSWQVPCIELLRVLINDLEDTPTYSDARLIRVLTVAAFQVLRECDFPQNFTVDIVASDITPDPTDEDGGTNNDDFINLMCLKAACIIDTGAAIQAANNATAGKDTVSSWDLKGVAQHTIDLLSKGYCATYSSALDDYLSGDGVICAAVMGPFRTMARSRYPNY